MKNNRIIIFILALSILFCLIFAADAFADLDLEDGTPVIEMTYEVAADIPAVADVPAAEEAVPETSVPEEEAPCEEPAPSEAEQPPVNVEAETPEEINALEEAPADSVSAAAEETGPAADGVSAAQEETGPDAEISGESEEPVCDAAPVREPGDGAPETESGTDPDESTVPETEEESTGIRKVADFKGADGSVISIEVGSGADFTEFMASLGYEGEIEFVKSSNPEKIAYSDGRLEILGAFGDETITVTVNGETVVISVQDPYSATTYSGLLSGIAAAQDYTGNENGERTVRLGADIILEQTLNITGRVILDLSGYVLTGSGSGSVINVNGFTGSIAGDLTIRDDGDKTERIWAKNEAGKWVVISDVPEGEEGIDWYMTKGGVITGGAAENGGGIADSGSLAMNGGTIIGCTATKNGGGISQSNTYTGCQNTLTNVTIIGCTAQCGGGVANSSILLMNGCTISGCVATESGGGVYNTEMITIGGCTISGCVAAESGGGVFFSSSEEGKSEISSGTVTGCTAKYGGGVYTSPQTDSETVIDSCTISGCTATDSGGGVFVESDVLNIGEGTTITENTDLNENASNVYLACSGSTTQDMASLKLESSFNGSIAVTAEILPTGDNSVKIAEKDASLADPDITSDRGYRVFSSGNEIHLGINKVAVTWGKTTLEYNGNEQLPEYSVDGIDKSLVTVSGARKDIGSGTATAVLKKEAVATSVLISGASQEFTIDPAPVVLKWDTAEFTYNGNTQTPTVTIDGFISGEDVGIEVSGGAKDAGTYSGNKAAKAALTGTKAGNYVLPENSTCEFVINKRQLAVKDTAVEDKTYDGTTSAALSNVGKLDGVISGEILTLSSSGTFDDANVGTGKSVTVSYTVSGDALKNYFEPSEEVITGNIIPKPVSITWGEITEFTYDTDGHVPKASTSDFISEDTSKVELLVNGKQTDAGSYTATAVLSGTAKGNYVLPANPTCGFIIKPAPLGDDAIDPIAAVTYTGSALTPSVTVRNRFSKALTADTDYTVSYSDNVGAGNAKVTVTFKGNYTGTGNVKFAIDKYTGNRLTAEPTAAQDLHTDGVTAASLLETPAEAEFGTVLYSIDGGSTWSETVPEVKKSGVYEVMYKVDETDNYNGLSGSVSVTVKEKAHDTPTQDTPPQDAKGPVVTTTDEGCGAEVRIISTTAEIVVKDENGDVVSPENVTIVSTAALIESGARTAEIRMSDTLTVEIDLESAMVGRNDCTVTIDFEDGVITLKFDERMIFEADMTDIMDRAARLVYDGKTVKAIDDDGRIIAEFDLF